MGRSSVSMIELRDRIRKTEESYEFFLGYAAQGARSDRESPAGTQLRQFLDQMISAVDGLPECARSQEAMAAGLADFLATLESDARASLSALRLVAAQAAISSQMVDNLNASIHVRALLTDLFLLDDVLALGAAEDD